MGQRPGRTDLGADNTFPHRVLQYDEAPFRYPGAEVGRSYLLETNPYYVVKSTKGRLNIIGGRWIDTSSGLFIGITAVHKDDEKRAKGEPGPLMCKDKHRYDESQIFPLRERYFEGVPVKIAYAYTELLEEGRCKLVDKKAF